MTIKIVGIPLLQDNYAWLLYQEESDACAIIDPSEAQPVTERIAALGLRLRWILATHHHPDHVGGIDELVAWAEARGDGTPEVYGSQYDAQRGRVPRVTHPVADGDTIEVVGCVAQCTMVPGHTLGAVAYHVADAQAVFTGDTLFTAGCGRLFEGSPEQMHASLQRLAALPDTTQIYCGHEYTEKNLRFAASLEPDNTAVAQRLHEVQQRRARGEATVPAPLSVERMTNPFLRAVEPEMQQQLGVAGPVQAFAEMRRRRDHF